MNIPSISVIVPVYNAEKTLRQCVNSILNQQFKDFELLLIDDGSNDSSPLICEEYSQIDKRVKVFHKTNGGVSSARNVGLKSAKGTWITFVDSDDFLDDNYFNNIIKFSEDLLIVPYTWYKEGKRKKDTRLQNYKEVYGDEGMRAFFNRFLTSLILRGPCAKFYYKSLIADIKFNERMKVGEDIVFVHKYLLRCKSIRCCNESTYVVRQSDCSDRVKYNCKTDYAIMSLRIIFSTFRSLVDKWRIEKKLFISYFFYFKMICKDDWKKTPSKWYRNKSVSEFYSYIRPYLSLKQKITYYIWRIYSLVK